MTGRKRRRTAPDVAFREAVGSNRLLRHRDGLQAIKKGEGKGQISAEASDRLLGSVCIDDDCQKAHPSSSRWDYVIGYERENEVIAHYVEVHSAETSEVARIEQKLDWLMEFLREKAQHKLASFSPEYHWVASGRINIPQHTPQYRRLYVTLRLRGLQGPVKTLKLT